MSSDLWFRGVQVSFPHHPHVSGGHVSLDGPWSHPEPPCVWDLWHVLVRSGECASVKNVKQPSHLFISSEALGFSFTPVFYCCSCLDSIFAWHRCWFDLLILLLSLILLLDSPYYIKSDAYLNKISINIKDFQSCLCLFNELNETLANNTFLVLS